MKQFSGLLILIGAIVAAWLLLRKPDAPPSAGAGGTAGPGTPVPAAGVETVAGLAGSEKTALLEDPGVVQILATKYRLAVSARKAGSVEMVEGPVDGESFLWPGSQVNLEMFRAAGRTPAATENLFHSPIVFYTWDLVADALVSNGVVRAEQGVLYLDDLAKLIGWVDGRQEWKTIGVPRMWGKVSLVCTDPNRSNSGSMFSALLANVYNQGEVPTAETIEPLLPRLKQFFDRLGHMEFSSGVLFQNFVTQGVGAYPIMVGYENQLVEFALLHPEVVPLIQQKVRILYPRPTVWANHPFIALDAKGRRLLQALQDEEILKLAWHRHGFRSGILAGAGDIKALPFKGLPESIDAVSPTPGAEAMRKIAAALRPSA